MSLPVYSEMDVQETPINLNRNFEETLLETPKPQACSTVDKKSDLLLCDDSKVEVGIAESLGGGDAGNFLKLGIGALAEMKERLALAGLPISDTPQIDPRYSLAASSSLGILSERDFKDVGNLDSTDLLLKSLRLEDGDESEKRMRQTREEALRLLKSNEPEKSLSLGKELLKKELLEDSGRKSEIAPCTNKQSPEDLRTAFNFPDNGNTDASGFSQLANASQISRDESFCVKEWGEALAPTDLSLSGRCTSQPSINFMPSDDSFLKSLGPTDPPRSRRREENRTNTKPPEDSYEVGLKSYLGNTRWGRLDSDVSVPSIEEIAEAMRADEHPRALIDSVLGAESDSVIVIDEEEDEFPSRDSGHHSRSTYSCAGEAIVRYERFAVVGCGLQVNLKAENAKLTSTNPGDIMVEIMKGTDGELRVFIMPLKVGEIPVILTDSTGRLHHITITVEEPNLEVLSDECLDFGAIPDGSSKVLNVQLRNRNKGLLAICCIINQESEAFNLTEDINEIVLLPGEETTKSIIATAPLLNRKDKLVLRGTLEIYINLSEKFMPRKVVKNLSLKLEAFRTKLLVAKEEGQIQPGRSINFQLLNSSECPLKLLIETEGEGFSAHPSKLRMTASEKAVVSVSYIPCNSLTRSEGKLSIKVFPNGKTFRIPIEGAAGCIPPSSPTGSNMSSNRSETPSSLSETPDGSHPRGPLDLQSTKAYLIWGGVGLNSKQEKSCSLRNISKFREKLCFSLLDPSWSFHFVKDGKMKREMKASLDSMQKKELTVCLSPKTKGPLKASIVVTRIEQDMYKKVINLLGFGGRSSLQALGMTFDLESDSQVLLLDTGTASYDLTFSNTGDAPAYFYITQPCIEASVLEVEPIWGIVEEGGTAGVHARLRSGRSSPRLEEALKDSNPFLKISTLTITHGDYSTILRLLRLYKKYGQQCKDNAVQPIMKSLGESNSIFPAEARDPGFIAPLKDPLSAQDVSWLYQEGIKEWRIDVLMSKKTLEAVALDSTQQYINLNNTITDETIADQSRFSMI